MLKNYIKNYWWKFIVIFAVLLTDMLTKFLIVKEGAKPVDIIDGVLVIFPTTNEGAGFSILAGQTWLLIAITVVFLVGICVFDLFFKKKSKLYGVATALIIAGAIGNLIDRIIYGKVRDFIFLEFINFPIFNIADISLTVGAVLLAVYVLFFYDKSKAQKITQKNTQKDTQKNAQKDTQNTQQDGNNLPQSKENLKKEEDVEKD